MKNFTHWKSSAGAKEDGETEVLEKELSVSDEPASVVSDEPDPVLYAGPSQGDLDERRAYNCQLIELERL